MQLDFSARELTIKLVYYGPALSGKTTNLQILHELSTDETRGRLMTLETKDDRTLFFDLLPLTFKSDRDFSVRLKLYTVPGQVIHASTRKLVLQGADGVAFIADSQASETRNNAAAFKDLKENLREHGIELGKMPLVIQFNKQDLPAARPEAEIIAQAHRGKEPVFCASAVQHRGVVETFAGLLFLTWQSLDRTHGLSAKIGLDRRRFFGEITDRFRGKRPMDELLRSAHTAEGRELSKEVDL
jgi:signal recognition particle receptor subunit beta